MCGGPHSPPSLRDAVSCLEYHGRFINVETSIGLKLGGRLMEWCETENAKDTLCRNVTIYGHCRYKDSGSLPRRLELWGQF